MRYDIHLTPQAQDDLIGIFEYIAFHLHSFQNAVSQLDRLQRSIHSLDQMPKRFRLYDKEPWRSHDLRIMPVDNYLVFYIPNCEKKTVTIIRVIYGGRNTDKQLNIV